MIKFLSVAMGGACGAMLRYAISLAVSSQWGSSGWIATLFVNILGCFLMGLGAGWLMQSAIVPEAVRLALMVGFLGALTTFSSYSLDSYMLFQRGEFILLTGYVAGSVLLSFAGFGFGLFLTRQISAAGLS